MKDRSIVDSPQNGNITSKISAIWALEREEGPAAVEKALIELVRENPTAHQAYLALARVLSRQKKTEYALRAADRAVELSPMDDKAHASAGLIHMRLGDTEGATNCFRQALVINPNSVQALLGAASVKLADENYDDALELCQKVLDDDPTVTRAQELVARINMRAGRTDVAADELRKLLESGKASERALKAYVRQMRSEGRLDEALAIAKLDLETAPSSRRKVTQFSRLARSVGKPELGLDQFRSLVESGEAKDLDIIRFVAMLIRHKKFEEAEEAIGKVPPRRFLRPFIEKLHGDIHLGQGDPGEAIKRFRRALHAAKLPQTEVPEISDGMTTDEASKQWQEFTENALREALKTMRSGGAVQNDSPTIAPAQEI